MATGICSDTASFTIGQKVRVAYANWDYDHSQIDSVGDQWGFAVVLGLAAFVLMPIGFVLLTRVRLQGHSLDPIGFWDPH